MKTLKVLKEMFEIYRDSEHTEEIVAKTIEMSTVHAFEAGKKSFLKSLQVHLMLDEEEQDIKSHLYELTTTYRQMANCFILLSATFYKDIAEVKTALSVMNSLMFETCTEHKIPYINIETSRTLVDMITNVEDEDWDETAFSTILDELIASRPVEDNEN